MKQAVKLFHVLCTAQQVNLNPDFFKKKKKNQCQKIIYNTVGLA